MAAYIARRKRLSALFFLLAFLAWSATRFQKFQNIASLPQTKWPWRRLETEQAQHGRGLVHVHGGVSRNAIERRRSLAAGRCTDVLNVSAEFGSKQDYDTTWSWPTHVNPWMNCARPICMSGRSSRSKRFIVLRWSRTWKSQPIPSRPAAFLYCRTTDTVLYYTSDRTRLASADIVEFHDPDTVLQDLPERVHPYQLFMVLTWESPIRGHSHTTDDGLMGQYNLLRSYRFDSDLVKPFFPPCQHESMTTQRIVPFAERHKEAVAFVTSNCDAENRRQDFVRDLSAYIEVHSYGRCLHNRDLSEDTQQHSIGPLETLSRYKFYIAIENSNCWDYVSEKLLRAWQLGSIPIVTSWKGSPDYTRFSPTNHSFIDAGKFSSAETLARYLKRIANDEALFNWFLSYRRNPSEISKRFDKMFSQESVDVEGWCPLVERMTDDDELEVMAGRRLTGDHSCAPRGVFSG